MVYADLLSNIEQTWKAVGQDVKKFIERATPVVDRILKQYGGRPANVSVAEAISLGTDKNVILSPKGELIPRI
jgi:hypothetical protein